MLKRFLCALTLLMLFAAPGAYAGGVTVALGVTNTSQLLLPANTYRHYLLIQNLSHTVAIFCSVGQTATGATATNGFEIAPGANWEVYSPSPSAATSQGISNDIECITAASTANAVALEQ